MDYKLLGLLVGGLLPAIFLGFAGIFQKMSTNEGISLGPYVTITGLAVTAVGLLVWLFTKESSFSIASGLYAALFGFFWAVGSVLIATSLMKYNANISQLVPLYNMNTLITVVAGLVLLGEYKNMNLTYLLSGASAILVGGYLCSQS